MLSLPSQEFTAEANMPITSRSLPFRYGVVVLRVGVATLARIALWPVLGPELPLLLFWPAVIIGAWYGGFWPGVLTSALSALSACYFLLEPRLSFYVKDPAHLAGAVLFALEGSLFSFLCERLQRAMRARRQAEQLRQAERREVERKIAEENA